MNNMTAEQASPVRKRVAVIGAGISGLTAAYILKKAADVTIYESAYRLGGHADTHDVTDGSGKSLAVDTGFIVHNPHTYPTLRRLFEELGVETQEADPSLSVRCDGCGLEYAGAKGLPGLFARRRSLISSRYLAMLAQVPAFNFRARRLLDEGSLDPSPTLDEFLRQGRFSRYFVQHYITPLVSAVWSCGPELAGQYPARYLFPYFARHGLLSIRESPSWRTVVGGSRTYVERLGKQLPIVRLATPVRAVRRFLGGIEIYDDADNMETFDAVVLATHADQALRLLADPNERERAVLGAFSYSENEVLLHTDAALLPRRAAARASWNYLLPACQPSNDAVQVSYHMNQLQCLDADEDYVVTLNGRAQVRPEHVLERATYRHPIYTPASVAAQRRLHEIASPTTVFAGAYHGWGGHEDGCRSGLQAAQALGVNW